MLVTHGADHIAKSTILLSTECPHPKGEKGVELLRQHKFSVHTCNIRNERELTLRGVRLGEV